MLTLSSFYNWIERNFNLVVKFKWMPSTLEEKYSSEQMELYQGDAFGQKLLDSEGDIWKTGA